MPSFQDHALALARRGWPVFPLIPGAKRPLYKNGFHDATTDPATILAWWEAEPQANIGLYPDPAGLAVIDFDYKKGAADSLFDLELTSGVLPETLKVETWSGGHHFYYWASLPSTVGRLGKGIDTRGIGGYVVAPGSIVDGKEYRIVVDREPAVIPTWLPSRLTTIDRDEDAKEFVGDIDKPVNVERARDYLRRTQPAIQGAGGDDWTYKTACVARDFGLSEETCLKLLLEEWNDRCQPPWHPDELATKVENAYNYAGRKGGSARGVSDAALEEITRRMEAAGPQPGAPRKQSRFRPLTWDEVQGLPEPRWLVEGTLPQQSLSLVFGAYGTYKSFLVLDMILHAATAREWAGHAVPAESRVLYVAGEGAYGIRKRVSAWAEAREIDRIENFRLVPAMPLFGNDEDLREFAQEQADFRPQVIVVDTVAHAMAGLDENAQKDAGTFISRCVQMAQAFNAAVILVHHTGKDQSKGARGSTVIPGAVDVMFEVQSPRMLEAVVTMRKMKDAEAWEKPQGFQGRKVGPSLVFDPANLTPAINEMQRNLWADTARRALEDAPGNELPVPTRTLARWVSAELNDNEDSIHDFLRRTAANGVLSDCVFERTTNGKAARSFNRPSTDDETD